MALASALAYGAVMLLHRSVTRNAAVGSLTVFLVVLAIYSPTLRGLFRDLRAMRAAAKATATVAAMPDVAPGAGA